MTEVKEHRRVYCISVVVWLVLTFACFWFGKSYENYCNIFTAWGTGTSIIGFGVALWQIAGMRHNTAHAKSAADDAKNAAHDAKQKTNEIYEAVQSNVKRVNQMIACSDIRSFAQIPNEILKLIDRKQYRWAGEKMNTLRTCLNDIKCNPEYEKAQKNDLINGYLAELADNAADLSIIDDGNAISSTKLKELNQFLYNVSSFLETLAGNVKYSNLSEVCHG